MILILRQFLVDCQPATGEVRAMGFVSVTFGFGYGMQAPPEPLHRTREPSLPSPIAFYVPAFCTAANRPFPTACALLRKPRRSAKFRPMDYLRGGSARCRLYSTELFASRLQIA